MILDATNATNLFSWNPNWEIIGRPICPKPNDLSVKCVRNRSVSCSVLPITFQVHTQKRNHLSVKFVKKGKFVAHNKVFMNSIILIWFSFSYSFFMKTTLIRHVRGVHERQNQQVCHICAKVYQSTRALQEHLKEHSDVPGPRINCQICGFSLKNEISLRAHMTSHAGTTFPCPECEKILTNRVALANHIKIHGSKLHKCEVCGHEFTRAESLRVGAFKFEQHWIDI